MRRLRSSARQYFPRLSPETPLSSFVSRRKRYFMEELEEDEITTETDLPTHVLAPSLAEKLPVRRLVRNPMPVFAAISTGENMDERLSVKEDFCRPEIIGGHPLHLFSVCDARGGPRVSLFFFISSTYYYYYYFLICLIYLKEHLSLLTYIYIYISSKHLKLKHQNSIVKKMRCNSKKPKYKFHEEHGQNFTN